MQTRGLGSVPRCASLHSVQKRERLCDSKSTRCPQVVGGISLLQHCCSRRRREQLELLCAFLLPYGEVTIAVAPASSKVSLQCHRLPLTPVCARGDSLGVRTRGGHRKHTVKGRNKAEPGVEWVPVARSLQRVLTPFLPHRHAVPWSSEGLLSVALSCGGDH